jgi:GR25 family glycosyltransferase involved in LPS biosynthesis
MLRRFHVGGAIKKLPSGLLNLPLRILSFPAARALLVCGLIWLLGFSYGRLFLWRDPHSAYFRSEGVYDLQYSAVRQREAREFIAKVTTEATEDGAKPQPKAGPTPAVCAAFVSVRRDGDVARMYMADAMGSMLSGLDPRERAALTVKLLFANTEPARHPDWNAPWVKPLVDDADGYHGLGRLELAGLRKAEEEHDLQLKGVFDYLYVIERCLEETKAPFIAVFEDDIVFSGDWMARTMRGLQYLVRDHKKAEDDKDWLYLRLFYTETHLGWSAERDWWYNHLPLTLAMAAGGSGTLLLLLRLFGCGGRLRLDWVTIAVVSLLVAPGFTVLAFMAGKHNLPLPGFSLHHNVPFGPSDSALAAGVSAMDNNACCTQALVFNRETLPDLIKNLRKRERGQTDSMIEEYCDATGLKRFALREQAVQHVGLVSSRGMAAKHTKSVWAFWFEANKPSTVEKTHQKVLEQVDWAMFDKMASGQ